MKNVLLRVVVPALILLAAIGCAGAMIMLQPSAERSAPAAKVTRVEVVRAQARSVPAKVMATGSVQAAQEVRVLPEVSGRIVWQSDALVPGGRLAKGTTFARIESRDYELRVEQARSTVKQAELELELEEGRQGVAAREWALLGNGRDPDDAPLALRKPQLQAAQQALASANSGLEQAELNLERTRLRAPFNALVLNESIDPGQVVGAQSTVATLVGTDRFWVNVSVPVEQLPVIRVPGVDEEEGSRAAITQRLGNGASITREGTVMQLLGQLDPQTRTATLLIGVDQPLESDEGGLPLLPGAYVDVALEGRVLEEALWVPRTAVYEGDTVWVANAEDTLERHTVTIGWREADHVVVTDGLEASSRVVVSPLALPVEGMAVELASVGE